MAIALRADYDAAHLRAKVRESKDAGQTRRLLALAAIYDGASRTEAAAMGGVTLQIVRDWVLKLNAGGPEALVDYRGPGPQPILIDAHRTALAQAVEDGPIPAIALARIAPPANSLSNGASIAASCAMIAVRCLAAASGSPAVSCSAARLVW